MAVQTPLVDFILNDLGGNFVPVNTACIFLPLLGLPVPILSILFVRRMRRAKLVPHATPAPVLTTPQLATPDVELDALRTSTTPDSATQQKHDVHA